MAMFEFHWILVFQLVYSTHSYQLQCPDISQRLLRASGYCTSRLRSKYTCLFDTNMLSFSEQCNRNPDFVTPGEKYVISGNLRNVDCSLERYQPFRLWSNVSGECLHQKSLCEGEGQVIANHGLLAEDRTCRCDYTKGYIFTQQPKQNCSCSPTEEDCSCYISKCPDGSVLTSDYECAEEKTHVESKCPLIVIERDGLQIPKIKTNAENEKQLSTRFMAVSAICLLILVYTATVFVMLIAECIKEKNKSICKMEDLEKQSIANNGDNNSTQTSIYFTTADSRTTNDETAMQTHTGDVTGLTQIKLENATLVETITEYNKVLESQKARILEYETLLKERDEMIKDRNTRIANKEIENSQKEAQHLKSIGKLEMDRRDLYNKIQESKGNIRVFCRVRPVINHDKQGSNCTVDHLNILDQKTIQVVKTTDALLSKKPISKNFTFDKVFNNKATQDDVFTEISQIVQSALDGYNVCIFAYGQTGSGKTYTMEGSSVDNNDENRGIIPRAVQQIFNTIRNLNTKGWIYNVDASCLEIYGDVINDLLCDTKVAPKLEIKDKNNEVYVSNLKIQPVTKDTEVYQLLQKASEKRKKADTESNLKSSRSHSVFTLKLRGENPITEDTATSTFNLVDLAGNERLEKSKVERQEKREAININLSLTYLGKFIRAIRDKDKAPAYRESKLTHLLHRSIGGNSKTIMFVNVSPKEDCVEETITSLTFATEAKQCKKGIAQQNK